MKEAMLKIAITLSMLSIAFGIEPSSATLSDADLLFFEIDAVNPLPSKIDPTINFNSLISSESAKNILLASSEVSFQSESSQVKWLENKQKEALMETHIQSLFVTWILQGLVGSVKHYYWVMDIKLVLL